MLELGYLYSGEPAPVSGVFKGRHTCGRNCCYAVWNAGKPLPFCVDCGLIRFSLFAVCPSAESALYEGPDQDHAPELQPVR